MGGRVKKDLENTRINKVKAEHKSEAGIRVPTRILATIMVSAIDVRLHRKNALN